jgi:Uma2 family endonuclease
MDEAFARTATVARMTFADFAAFYGARPPGERWELIDGEAIKMAPPKTMHQRISGNLRDLLQARLPLVRPSWYADQEIGVRDRSIDPYAPQPDVTVGDLNISMDQVWAERFYFVVEVLSDDRRDVLDKKRAYYQAHDDCRGFMFVRQDRIEAELATRRHGAWTFVTLTTATAVIDIPDIGIVGQLGQAYRATPLEPK